jgi:polyphosphate kinase
LAIFASNFDEFFMARVPSWRHQTTEGSPAMSPTVSTMTEPHKRANRHPETKTAYRVKNWAAYDKALRDRVDITLWFSQEAAHASQVPELSKSTASSIDSSERV